MVVDSPLIRSGDVQNSWNLEGMISARLFHIAESNCWWNWNKQDQAELEHMPLSTSRICDEFMDFKLSLPQDSFGNFRLLHGDMSNFKK